MNCKNAEERNKLKQITDEELKNFGQRLSQVCLEFNYDLNDVRLYILVNSSKIYDVASDIVNADYRWIGLS